MAANLVVARYRDGRTIKGTSLNVDPAKPTFHVKTEGGAIEVRLVDLKALFFVKDPVGNSAHNEASEPTSGDARLVGAKRIAVRFEDGETVTGMSNRYPPLGKYFFMLPIDPKSNNVRILVNRAATVAITEAAQPANR
ncbi:MAG: hypothetical protein FJ206_00790 [Gemmatimonadetes bacterium]|nr:hypothetical protein [Gemmatimonadota bacterium]